MWQSCHRRPSPRHGLLYRTALLKAVTTLPLDIHPTAKAGRFLRRIPSYMGRFSEVPVSMADARRSISIPARSYSASAGCHGVSRRSRNSYRYSEFAFGKCFTAGPSPANRQHSIVKDQSVPVYDCPSGTQPGRYSRIGHPQYARNRQCLTGPTVPWTYWYKATKGSQIHCATGTA